MSVPLTCRACGARLKLPPGCTKKKARCPKCNARMNLTAALEATAYLPSSVLELSPAVGPVPAKPGKPGASPPATAPVLSADPDVVETLPNPATPAEREEDPLPYAAPARPPASPSRPPPPPEPEEDPLPYLDLNPAARPAPPPLPAAGPDADAVPTLDEAPPAEPPPLAATPFRAPARVVADSAGMFVGPCEVVLLPHGLFLESVPFRPFLYAPVGTPTSAPHRRGLTVYLPDGRTVSLDFTGRNAAALADDAAGFLAGERGLPDPREYRANPGWLLWLALIFAVGLAVGPVVMAQATGLGTQTGLLLGGGFALAGLLANSAVVLLTRLPVFGKVAVMATVAAATTGVLLLVATAYLAGKKAAEQEKPDPAPPPVVPDVVPKPPDSDPKIDPRRAGLPTAIDAAYADGVYHFEPGSDDVTAIGLTPDADVMLIGYKSGATRVWRFDNLTIDPFAPGPRADGQVARIQFDAAGAVAYLACDGGAVAANWNPPPEFPLKIQADHFAAFTFPVGERFAAYRAPNKLELRQVPTLLVKKPPPPPKDPKKDAAKGFSVLAKSDEATPADVKAPLVVPRETPTFLAWHPTGKLLAGLPNGSVLSWGAAGPKSEVVTKEHKGPVRAWAASPNTWDFATGDDKGTVGLWANKSMTPRMFLAATSAVTQLAFSPSGSHLAVADSANVVWVWDLAANRSIVKASRPHPVKALAFGPNDDLLMMSEGKTVALWHLTELAKQP